MIKIMRCPDCHKSLAGGRNSCVCGWFSTSVDDEDRYRCRYMESGVRCENMGTVSKFVKGDYWLCRKHVHCF